MSRTDERADDEPSLGRLVMLAARRVREARVAAFEPYGLAAHQARAFLVVLRWSAGELRLSRLAERLHIAPRSVTEVVDALEEKGLVRRSPSPTDRRATVVEPTEAGRELGHKLKRGELTGGDSTVFAALTETERGTLTRLLAKVVDA